VDNAVDKTRAACGQPVERRGTGWGGAVEAPDPAPPRDRLTSENVVHGVWTKKFLDPEPSQEPEGAR